MKRIRIQCIEKVQYDQIVEIEDAQWEELKGKTCSEMEDEGMSPLIKFINLKEVSGSRGFDDIELYEVNEKDEYNDGEQWEPWAKRE